MFILPGDKVILSYTDDAIYVGKLPDETTKTNRTSTYKISRELIKSKIGYRVSKTNDIEKYDVYNSILKAIQPSSEHEGEKDYYFYVLMDLVKAINEKFKDSKLVFINNNIDVRESSNITNRHFNGEITYNIDGESIINNLVVITNLIDLHPVVDYLSLRYDKYNNELVSIISKVDGYGIHNMGSKCTNRYALDISRMAFGEALVYKNYEYEGYEEYICGLISVGRGVNACGFMNNYNKHVEALELLRMVRSIATDECILRSLKGTGDFLDRKEKQLENYINKHKTDYEIIKEYHDSKKRISIKDMLKLHLGVNIDQENKRYILQDNNYILDMKSLVELNGMIIKAAEKYKTLFTSSNNEFNRSCPVITDTSLLIMMDDITQSKINKKYAAVKNYTATLEKRLNDEVKVEDNKIIIIRNEDVIKRMNFYGSGFSGACSLTLGNIGFSNSFI